MLDRDLQFSLMAAWREAALRRHEYLSVEHLFFALLHNDLACRILEDCGADLENLRQGCLAFLEKHLPVLPADADREPVETLAFQRVMQRAIMHVRDAEKPATDAGDVLASIFEEEDSHVVTLLTLEGVARLDVLRVMGSLSLADREGTDDGDGDEEDEDGENPSRSAAGPGAEREKQKQKKGSPLDLYCVDLVARAAAGHIDPLIGRESELRRILQVLCRRLKNNPVLVGEPGVGKTALAEGLALRLAAGEVPPILAGAKLYALDMGAVLAGTKFRGQFEERLKGVVAELKKIDKAILFIDEIHTIVGAGAVSGGSLDASNILKPVFASGEIRCMGATTHEEFRQHFEKDRALARRFQVIQVPEPTHEEALAILKGLRGRFEEHHGVRYTEDALAAAVELSAKHINDRCLPDKAVDVLDEAGAAMHLTPGGRKRKKILRPDIARVVSLIARVPIEAARGDERERLAGLETGLRAAVFGQDGAIASLCRALKRSFAGLGNPEHPVGSFLFTGPTGVGKTEVSRQLATQLGVAFLRFDMSEYMEQHAVARLIGAPPGYVGYDQGGQLTERIRQHPHAVLLLDEIEKAHPDIFNVLLQVMDHATLTDNAGRKADFRKVVLIMTSNAGAREMGANAIGFGDPHGDIAGRGRQALEKHFAPEFRNRLDEVIFFDRLSRETMLQVVDKNLRLLEGHLAARKVRLTVSGAARAYLAEAGYDPVFGARPLERLVQTVLRDPLADVILFGQLAGGGEVMADIDAGGKIVFSYPGE
jgi:ATP-dependent Clp protease ATP-binding subunit ClpA